MAVAVPRARGRLPGLRHRPIGRSVAAIAGPIAVTLPPAIACAALIAVAEPQIVVGLAIAVLCLVVVAARPIAGVALAIAAIPLELYSLPVGGALGVTAAEALFVLAGASFAVRRFLEMGAPHEPMPMARPLLLLLAAMVPGLIVAIEPFATAKILVMWSAFAAVLWLVASTGRRQTVERLLLVLAVSAAVVALLAVTTAGPQRVIGAGEVVRGRAAGAFGSPNSLASFLALALPGALALALRGRLSTRLVALASVAAIFAGLALSLSRGGLLAAIGALGFMLLWRPVRRVAVVGAVVIAVLVVNGSAAIDANESVDRVAQRLQTVSTGRTDPRLELWPRVPELIAQHPAFGIGANQFGAVTERMSLRVPGTGEPFLHAHNLVLNFAVELGLIGLAAALWLALICVRFCVAACRSGPLRERGPAFAVSAALLSLAMHGMVDVTLGTNVIAAVVFVLVACAVVLGRDAGRGAAASPATP